MVDLEAGPKGAGLPIILGKKREKKSQKDKKPAGQAKKHTGHRPTPFLIAQVLDPPLLVAGGDSLYQMDYMERFHLKAVLYSG